MEIASQVQILAKIACVHVTQLPLEKGITPSFYHPPLLVHKNSMANESTNLEEQVNLKPRMESILHFMLGGGDKRLSKIRAA